MAQIATGLCLATATGGLATVAASSLISSGINTAIHTAQTSDKDFNLEGYVRESIKGLATGALTGGGALVGSKLAARSTVAAVRVLARAGCNAGGSVANQVVGAAIDPVVDAVKDLSNGQAIKSVASQLVRKTWQNMPDKKTMRSTAASAAITSIVSQKITVRYPNQSSQMPSPSKALYTTAGGASAGLVSRGSFRMIRNMQSSGSPLTEGVWADAKQGCIEGAATGFITGKSPTIKQKSSVLPGLIASLGAVSEQTLRGKKPNDLNTDKSALCALRPQPVSNNNDKIKSYHHTNKPEKRLSITSTKQKITEIKSKNNTHTLDGVDNNPSKEPNKNRYRFVKKHPSPITRRLHDCPYSRSNKQSMLKSTRQNLSSIQVHRHSNSLVNYPPYGRSNIQNLPKGIAKHSSINFNRPNYRPVKRQPLPSYTSSHSYSYNRFNKQPSFNRRGIGLAIDNHRHRYGDVGKFLHSQTNMQRSSDSTKKSLFINTGQRNNRIASDTSYSQKNTQSSNSNAPNIQPVSSSSSENDVVEWFPIVRDSKDYIVNKIINTIKGQSSNAWTTVTQRSLDPLTDALLGSIEEPCKILGPHFVNVLFTGVSIACKSPDKKFQTIALETAVSCIVSAMTSPTLPAQIVSDIAHATHFEQKAQDNFNKICQQVNKKNLSFVDLVELNQASEALAIIKIATAPHKARNYIENHLTNAIKHVINNVQSSLKQNGHTKDDHLISNNQFIPDCNPPVMLNNNLLDLSVTHQEPMVIDDVKTSRHSQIESEDLTSNNQFISACNPSVMLNNNLLDLSVTHQEPMIIDDVTTLRHSQIESEGQEKLLDSQSMQSDQAFLSMLNTVNQTPPSSSVKPHGSFSLNVEGGVVTGALSASITVAGPAAIVPVMGCVAAVGVGKIIESERDKKEHKYNSRLNNHAYDKKQIIDKNIREKNGFYTTDGIFVSLDNVNDETKEKVKEKLYKSRKELAGAYMDQKSINRKKKRPWPFNGGIGKKGRQKSEHEKRSKDYIDQAITMVKNAK